MLGDVVEDALSLVGITQDRVSRWLGMPCKCEERKQKLNQLHAWAFRIVSGKTANAVTYFESMVSETNGHD